MLFFLVCFFFPIQNSFFDDVLYVLVCLCKVATKNLPKTGSICQVLVQLPHVFQLFNADSFMDQDARCVHWHIHNVTLRTQEGSADRS